MDQINEIIKKIQGIKPFLEEKYNIIQIGLFGSIVKGLETEKSDVDILVDFNEEGIGLFKFMELEEEFQKIINRKVDIVCKDALKPRIGRQILKEVQYL